MSDFLPTFIMCVHTILCRSSAVLCLLLTGASVKKLLVKVSVQQRLRWVNNVANYWVLASDCGAAEYFAFLVCRYLLIGLLDWEWKYDEYEMSSGKIGEKLCAT